jgi:hypothetical protein
MAWPDVVMLADPTLWITMAGTVIYVLYNSCEHWMIPDTIYFLITTGLGVGYGDQVPRSETGKVITTLLVPILMASIYRAALLSGRPILAMAKSIVFSVLPSRPAMLNEPDAYSDDHSYLVAAISLVLVVAPGAGLASWGLNLSLVDAVYFAAMSATTVGYGDIVPTSLRTEIFGLMYLWFACGTFAAAVEHCYKANTRRFARSFDIKYFADQLLLQETCWDSSDPASPQKPYVFARKADDGGGLSEAEFILAVLNGHELIDVPTLVSIRKQFAQLVAISERQAALGSGGEGAGSSGVADVGDGKRLGARAIFLIHQSEERVRQRPLDVEKGSTIPDGFFQPGLMNQTEPVALVDLTAPDGGYAEWCDHFWFKRVEEEREKQGHRTTSIAQHAADML